MRSAALLALLLVVGVASSASAYPQVVRWTQHENAALTAGWDIHMGSSSGSTVADYDAARRVTILRDAAGFDRGQWSVSIELPDGETTYARVQGFNSSNVRGGIGEYEFTFTQPVPEPPVMVSDLAAVGVLAALGLVQRAWRRRSS